MTNRSAWILGAVLAAAAVFKVGDASACGGCFVQQTEVTQVTGHKMILSVSQQQTTLYDQISYSGDPSSFAWILPVKGVANIGLSSDALFQNLDADTQTIIQSPSISCNPGGCGFPGGGGGFGSTTASGTGGGVTVVSQKVVGPYETVQLSASDPNALTDWLTMHNYNIPADIQPIIDAYVTDGFDFIALKLVPGKGISAMRPVRITTPGATPVLPLRMVAAGTGAITPITLYVIGEGRYEASNFPTVTLDPSQVIWNWDTSSSNYSTLKAQTFADSNNKAWITEDAEPFSRFTITNQLQFLVQSDPMGSGYADDMGQGADQAFTDDMLALFGNIPDSNVWITRLEGELSRAALADDLQVAASNDQTPVFRFIQVFNTTGTPPSCPPPQPCDTGEGGFGATGSTGAGWSFWGSGGASSGGASGGCAVNGDHDLSVFSAGLAIAALSLARRRRSRRAR